MKLYYIIILEFYVILVGLLLVKLVFINSIFLIIMRTLY